MSLKNDYGFWQFDVTSGCSSDNLTSNKVSLTDDNALKIRVSMFFDGTMNNKFNTEGRLEYFKHLNTAKAAGYEKRKRSGKSGRDINDSYSNDYSNVARLFKYYEKKPLTKKEATDCVYVEGIGTTSNSDEIDKDSIVGGPDKTRGSAIGDGETGIPEKVKKGCETLAKLCKYIAQGNPISVLTIDVFGFSRGAAVARHFIYEISKKADTKLVQTGPRSFIEEEIPAFGALGKGFVDCEYEFEGQIEIAFAGLFDTVPAYRLMEDGGKSALHLNAVDCAKNVLHLTSMDERRKQFGLSTINEKGSVAEEKALPGVHCDIGGSYIPEAKEKDKVIFAGSKKEALKEIDYLLEEGWYWSKRQLECKSGLFNNLAIASASVQSYIKTVGTKTVKTQYSFIPLLIMRDKTKRNTNGVKFKEYITEEYKIPKDIAVLKYTNDRLRDYVLENGEPMKFYTRKEIDWEIDLLKMKEGSLKAVNLLPEQHYTKRSTTRVNQVPIIEDLKTDNNSKIAIETKTELNADDYPNNPELQQKIKDHLALMILRAQYFHISHECSNLDMKTAFFDPYAASIRTKPSRKINRG